MGAHRRQRGGARVLNLAERGWLLPLMVLAGALGGLLWAMIPAVLKIRFNANEILVSLMLVYVARLFLVGDGLGAPARPRRLQLPREPRSSTTAPACRC